MPILVFSDIHGDRAALETLMERDADLYIAAGDLVSWGRGLDRLAPALQRRVPRVWVLPGNHEHESDIEAFCRRHKLNPLHGRHFEMDGWHIAGLGHSPPTPFDTPGEYTEEEFAARLAPFSGLKPLILVCHCPPLETDLDLAISGRHIGSRAVREFIEREQPAWFACGHVHEAAGIVTQFGLTRAVNAGKAGYLIEIPPAETEPRGSAAGATKRPPIPSRAGAPQARPSGRQFRAARERRRRDQAAAPAPIETAREQAVGLTVPLT